MICRAGEGGSVGRGPPGEGGSGGRRALPRNNALPLPHGADQSS